jgi:ABC-type sugar transport system substrate-binding protein
MRIRGVTLRWVSVLLVAGATFSGAATPNAHAAGKKLTIAFIQIGISANPFWADQARGATEAGRRLGINVRNISGNQKIADQVQRMNEAIDQHVDAIEIIPLDPKSIEPALIRARRAHIPVLVLYSVAKDATMISGFDDYHSGQIVGQYTAQVLQKKYGSVKGKVAVLRGALGQTLDSLRTNGFVNVLKKSSGIQVVSEQPTDWTADKAVSIMQDWLVKYPDLTVVYGLSDTITVPALNVALRNPNGKNILFASIDGDPIGLTAIKNGQMLATALYGPIYAGFRFTEMAYHLAKHQAMPRVRYLNSALVTQSNINAALAMENAMSNHIHTFNFDQGLTAALKQYSH